MKKAITNHTLAAIFIGGKLLHPGDTREFDEAELPGEHQEPALPVVTTLPSELERLAAVLQGNVGSVTAALYSETSAALGELRALEAGDRNRVGVIRAIDAEILARASDTLDQGDATFAKTLTAAQAELAAAKAALDVEADTHKHPELQAAVDAAQAQVDALSAG